MRVIVGLILVCLVLGGAVAEQVSAPSDLDSVRYLINLEYANDAIPVLESVIACDPVTAPRALLMISQCYDLLGRWDDARRSIDELQGTHRSSVPEREMRLRAMDHYLAQGQSDKYQSLRKRVEGDYRDQLSTVYYTVGRRRCFKHEYSAAMLDLRKAVQLGKADSNDDLADANYWLLHCLREEKRWKDVDELGSSLIKKYPAIAYMCEMEIGRGYREQQNYDKAIQHLDAAAKLCPRKDYYNFAFIERFLLDCHSDIGERSKAITLAEKLTQEYPNYSAWQWRLGWYYLLDKQYEKAEPLFRKVIDTSPRRWEIRKGQIFLSECMFNLGKGQEALDAIEVYFKNRPEMWDEHLLVRGAVLLYGPKDYEGCIEAEKQILAQVAAGRRSELVPTAVELIYESYGMMGELDQGAPMMEAQARSTHDAAMLCRVANDYLQAGNYKEASRLFKEVTREDNLLDAVRVDSMYGLARCYWETNMRNAARRLMQEIADKYPDTGKGKQAEAMLSLWSEVQ